jgi:ABC-type transport system involved in Fe-S cluster assembly fused permease/ATPase subunit
MSRNQAAIVADLGTATVYKSTYVDAVFVLYHGRVGEKGTHAELLLEKGIYSKMVTFQLSAHKPLLMVCSGMDLQS